MSKQWKNAHQSKKLDADLQAQLIAKAWMEDAFKQVLMSDPKATIENEFGTEILEGIDIQVLEQTPEKLYLVLPFEPVGDEELQSQSGSPEVTQLIAKATEDDAFKRVLLGNPKAAIENEIGAVIPEGIDIQVLEQTPTTSYLVLPNPPDNAEVSEGELTAVAGGNGSENRMVRLGKHIGTWLLWGGVSIISGCSDCRCTSA